MQRFYKFAYSPKVNSFLRPLSRQIYRLSKKKIIGISGKLNLHYKHYNFKFYTNQTSSVGQELYYNGPDQYEFTPLFEELIGQSSVFLDIGANIGYFSILGSKINPDCKIFAFEPSKGSLHFLQKNIEVNNCTNVKIVDRAISNTTGTLTFHEVTNSKYPWIEFNLNGSNSLNESSLKHEHRSYSVEVTTIQKCVEENSIDVIDLIKLDTECTEHWIIKDSIKIINSHLPIIICEIYPVIEKEMEGLIKDKLDKYRMFQYITKNNTLLEINSLSEINTSSPDRNFILCPQSKTHLISKFI